MITVNKGCVLKNGKCNGCDRSKDPFYTVYSIVAKNNDGDITIVLCEKCMREFTKKIWTCK